MKLPQLVLQNRCARGEAAEAGSGEDGPKTTDWFNVRCLELPWIAELAQPWKKDQKAPMNIFVYYSEAPDVSQERYLLEHWQCSYIQKSNTILQGSDVKALYNKFVIMFRSLLVYLKVLPAYRVFRSLSPTASAKIVPQVSSAMLTTSFPFGATKPEKIEIGRLDTPFGTIEVNVSYRKDVSFALSDRPEVIPAESIIPDYAPSLGARIRSSTKPVSIQSTPLRSRPDRPRASTLAHLGPVSGLHSPSARGGSGRVEAQSQPALADHSRLSFSPPTVGAQSMWSDARSSAPAPSRDRQNSEPPFPSFAPMTPSSHSASPRVLGAYSASPRGQSLAAAALAMAGAGAGGEEVLFSRQGDGERVLTAVSPPSFSMYERALHESPDPEFDGPVFSIEGSFAADEETDVNSFVRFCQSKPVLLLVEDENRQLMPSGPSSSKVVMQVK